MATNCCGRRLSDLLQEQQEPFLVRRDGAPQCRLVAVACGWRLRDHGGGSVSVSNGGARSMLCGSKTLLWDLAGCFPCGARDRFRWLPRSGDIGGEEDRDDGKQLSPVSVLQLRSDEESTDLNRWDDEDGSKPSTSASSPSSESDHHRRGAAFTFYNRSGGMVPETEGEDSSKSLASCNCAPTEHAIVSAWERIAADISRIPRLVELDLSGSAIGEEEAQRVGESIEAMIFEEVRWEAVRDICSALENFRAGTNQNCATPAPFISSVLT